MGSPARPDDTQQLSLFETLSAFEPAPDKARLPPGTAAGTPALAPAPASASIPAPTPRFHHQRAQRAIALGGHLVGYEFRRARRRSIGFVVGVEGLSVSAPRWVAVAEVEQALQAKASWILRKLQEQQERAQRLQAAKVVWQDGTTLPYLGDTVIVLLDSRVTGAQLNSDGQSLPGVPRLTLHLGLPQTATQEQIREAVQSWLQRQARQLFEARCAHFAPQLGVRVKRLSLSSAATRWGSASADGTIRLNWRLIHFTPTLIDYVVAHELAHLREMNHSARFWDVVRSVVPDFETARSRLREESIIPQ